MSPPGALHGSLQNRMVAALLIQGEIKGYGKAFTEVGIVLDRKPDHIVGADAAFIATRSLPARIARRIFRNHSRTDRRNPQQE